MNVPHDNCDSCQEDYAFDKTRDILCLYLTSPQANHVEATCPYCGAKTDLYLLPNMVIEVMKICQLSIRVEAEASKEVLQEAAGAWSQVDPPIPDVHMPRAWLTQLFDDLRHFDHDCDGSCDS